MSYEGQPLGTWTTEATLRALTVRILQAVHGQGADARLPRVLKGLVVVGGQGGMDDAGVAGQGDVRVDGRQETKTAVAG